jgi:zinc protease
MISINQKMVDHLPGSGDINRTVLSNGITLLTRYHPDSPSIVINGYLSSGSLYDPQGKQGRAHFLAASLLRGTKKKNFQEIYNTLESMGASLMFGASVHSTSFGGRALCEDLSSLVNLLAEGLQEPVFPTDQIERLRAMMLSSLAIRAQDTGSMASMIFDRHIFKDHPYGLPEDGFLETIQAITREDLVEGHARYFGPRNMVLVVTGGVAADQVRRILEDYLGNWQNADQAAEITLTAPVTPQCEIREHIEIPGKSQTDIVMGNSGLKRSSDDYFAASLANNILGQFGMMGRIGYAVREQAGLAYYASSSMNASMSAGSWEVDAGVNPANVNQAIALIKQEIERFITEGVTNEELEESQANFIGRLPLSMESNQGVAGAMINMERFQLGLDYYRTFPAAIAAVTREEVREVAERYLNPDKMVIVSAGVSG